MIDVTTIFDHGYVKFIESWGSDERIIEAARMSTDKGFIGWGDDSHSEQCPNYGDKLKDKPCEACDRKTGDEKLLAYLYNHKHMTPFEMAGMVIEVQAPIFVFREWHRHRTQSYNELSARYTELPNLFYLPSLERLMAGKQSKSNKQSSTEGFTEEEARRVQECMETQYAACRTVYESLLGCGVAREIARSVIPVAQYSRMRASANLRNWLAFLTLRMDSSAQYEIRQYANIVGTIIAQKFPRTWSLFNSEKS